MLNPPKKIACCALIVLLALYVVGVVSHGVVRHIVQTLPLWFAIVLGFRGRELAKWTALPCFVIWLGLMSMIWLFLLGWAHVISGHFTPIEVAMTLIVGAASLTGLVVGVRWSTNFSGAKALLVTVIFVVLQVIAMRISFLPSIAKDHF